ncbi:MAG: hypothetical protein CV090_03100 [Nitrospira sp. WS238]|nr:hypothetical protein [Nitrospira sp. WS238]
MTIFWAAILIVATLQTSCVSTRTYTEQEKVVLARTQSIWVEVDKDDRALSDGMPEVTKKVVAHVKDKLTRSGLTMAPDRPSADATLQLYFDSAQNSHPGELAAGEISSNRHAPSMRIEARLHHKEVGPLFHHVNRVPPPYDFNFPSTDLIMYVDTDVLQALFKSPPSSTKNE